MEKHDLLHEFPDYQDKIHELKMNDHHFRNLFDEYDELEHEIRRLNTGVETGSDALIHAKKAKLLHIKDTIFAKLVSCDTV